ncbi:MAG: hypothetical protein ACOCX2_08390, partial [Armatimonadota bacterium]
MSERADVNLTPRPPLRSGEGGNGKRLTPRVAGEVGFARALLLVFALTALTFAGGCIFVDAQFSMAPDGATAARMEAGVLKSIAEQGEGDFTTEVNETLVEENWTELEAFERGQWQVQAWEGEAGPGERL